MYPSDYNLAIETSCSPGAISLGKGSQFITSHELPDHRTDFNKTTYDKARRNRLDLLPAIDDMMKRYNVLPHRLGEVYLSIGPGSFTGLRNAVVTAKVFSYVLGVRLVAVPTVQAIVQCTPTSLIHNNECRHLAVLLNCKDGGAYAQLFESHNGDWVPNQPAVIGAITEFLNAAPRPLAILGDPTLTLGLEPSDSISIINLPPAVKQSAAVWELGRKMSLEDNFTEPDKLEPLYARPPEAEQLWKKRHAPASLTINQDFNPARQTAV